MLSCILLANTEVVNRLGPRSDFPLHFNIRKFSKFVWKNKMLALSVCYPQPCSSAGCRFAVSRSRLDCFRWIVSFPQLGERIRWKAFVNWNLLRFYGESVLVREIPNPRKYAYYVNLHDWHNTHIYVYICKARPLCLTWHILRTSSLQWKSFSSRSIVSLVMSLHLPAVQAFHYICMYVNMYMCMCVYVYVCINTVTCTHKRKCVHAHAHTRTHTDRQTDTARDAMTNWALSWRIHMFHDPSTRTVSRRR